MWGKKKKEKDIAVEQLMHDSGRTSFQVYLDEAKKAPVVKVLAQVSLLLYVTKITQMGKCP